tara:strand:- start:3460 stop:3915 length:456 start_codon:yes stop_codon:yes gene_type:complete
MSNPHLERCVQVGRELAIKEAALGIPLGAGVAVPALLAASGLLAKTPRLRAANRLGATGIAAAGGGAAGAGIMNQDSFKNLQSIYQSLDLSQLTPGLVGEAIQGMGPLALISGYGANKLVRGGEKLNRAIRAARARSRSTFRVKPVDLLTF